MNNKIAIIGGSGVHDNPGFKDLEWKVFETKYFTAVGNGVIEYQERNDGIMFIPRHGHSVKYGPSCTQYGANLIAAKILGADVVIATSAVGSLDGAIIPVKSLVVPADYIDKSRRDDNLFGKGFVVHANPIPAFSEGLRKILYHVSDGFNSNCFQGGRYKQGTYVCIPGDRFGTKAEGKIRAKYADIVGMTICPEASMAMQLGMHYAVAAFVVDVNLDANHEGGTLAIMRELSSPEKVPAYIERVIAKTKEFVQHIEPIPNLRGNIIPHATEYIQNRHLRDIAEGLIQTYCK
ncbi:hypothetical protein HZA96_01750 [Candidatus Woesearchaeota archaeon]|nr:hypothetical protein [Candidatus Woesearchaeota archaeon]